MNCIIPSITDPKKDSILYRQLFEAFPNEDNALDYWVQLTSEEFISNVYGVNYVDEFKKAEGNRKTTKGDHYYVNELGEPFLYKNKSGESFIYLVDGTKYFLDYNKLNLNPVTEKFIVDQALYEIFGDNVQANADLLEGANFSVLYEEGGFINALMNNNKRQLKIVQELVEKRLREIGIKTVTDREELQDDDSLDIEETDSSRVLDVRQSFEKDTKDNASANIKLLFNFVPKLTFSIVDGNQVYEEDLQTIDLGNGFKFETAYFASFTETWNKFSNTLANVSVANNENTITLDKFDVMVNKMREKYSTDATVQYLLDQIEGFPDYKKTEFVQAFNLADNNLTTTIFDGDNVSIFDSSASTSPEKKLKKEWSNFFINSFFKYDNKTKKLVYDRGNDEGKVDILANKINDFVAVLKDKDTKYDDKYFDTLLSLLNESSIKISKKALYDYLVDNGDEGDTDLFNAIYKTKKGLTYVARTLKGAVNDSLFNEDTPLNPLIDSSKEGLGAQGFIDRLIPYEIANRPDLFENTSMGAEGKANWNYSQKTFLQDKIEKVKLRDEEQLRDKNGFYTNSLYHQRYREALENNDDEFFERLKIGTFLNLKNKGVGDAGVDNKKVSKADQFADQINKTLRGRIKDEKSMFYSPAPADKGRFLHIIGFDPIIVEVNEEGNFSKEVIDVFSGYALDEIYRTIDEYQLIKTPEARKKNANKLVNDYHFKFNKAGEVMFFQYTTKNDNGEEVVVLTNDETIPNIVPAGNAFKSYLFPLLNPFADNNMLLNGDKMFDENNDLLWSIEEFKDHAEVVNLINELLELAVSFDRKQLEIDGVLKAGVIKGLDKRVLEYHNGDVNAVLNDFSINQLIADIEFSKFFMGDWAEAKDLADLSKRYPATYTDGIYLHMLKDDPTWFTVATLPKQITESLNIGQLRKEYPKIAKAYSGINKTDAQGWITWDRWKFIQRRSNHWSPQMEAAIDRIESNTATAEDWQFTAQPVKGVFFGKSEEGHATYIKYSAAPLIPHVIKGTKLEELHNQMVAQGIDEAVVVDGIKLGAKQPSEIDTNDFSKSKFYTTKLRNDQYKIQQDLTPKGNKQTLLGSQVTKNIIEGITMDQQLGDLLGEQVINDLIETVSDLSNKGKIKLQKDLGLDEDNNIVDQDAFYDKLVKTAIDKNSPDNLITALKRGMPLDLIANKRTELQYIIQSIVKKATVDIKTNGGAYIQESSWLIDEFIDEYNIDQLGIRLLVDKGQLKPPNVEHYDIDGNTVTKQEYNKLPKEKQGRRKVNPGQVFISSQYISKLVPNWKSLSTKELQSLLSDERVKRLIGYRIPNQSLASTDSLEIVGILPESMGDTIIPYADITTKTGSDFDIDKMYIIMPNLKVKYKAKTYKAAKKYLDDIKMSKEDILAEYEDLADVISVDTEWLNSLPLNELKSNFIDDVLFSNNLKNNPYREDYINKVGEFAVEKLEYIEYDDTKPNGVIKDGVSELFESNPELANAVYKALGFNNNNQYKGTINVYWGQAESDTSTKILSNLAPRRFIWKGKEYGSVEHAYQSNKSGTFDQVTYDAYNKIGGYGKKIRGKGTVAEMKAANSLGLMRSLVVESFQQNRNSEAAKKLLQYENFTHNTNELIDKAFLEGLKLAQKELLNNNQITTQQKQQAQQLYSQYLDTIFPDSQVKDIVYHGSKNKNKVIEEGFKTNSGLVFFSPVLENAYGKNIVFAKVNLTNPAESLAEFKEFDEEYNIEGYINNPEISNRAVANEIAVKHLDKIHILGSKQDIEGFKKTVKSGRVKAINEQSKEAVENKLIETMRAVLEAPEMFEKMMSPLDNKVLEEDIRETFKEYFQDEVDPGLNFFLASYQINKKFDNSVGKAGTGLTSNQLVDMTLAQLADLKMNRDLGINPTTDNTTSFNQIKDAEGELNISEVISLFLTAYVDIAKDPYISKGNHNQLTANTTFMLLRAGVPFRIVNRIIGQESVRKYIDEKKSRQARVVDVKYTSVRAETIDNLLKEYKIPEDLLSNIQEYTKDTTEFIGSLSKFRDKGDYESIQKAFENKLKKPTNDYITDFKGLSQEEVKKIKDDNFKIIKYVADQITVLDYFTYLENLGQEFGQTVLSTKQDVKGGGKDFISAFIDANRIESIKQGDLFENYDKKFTNTFIGTYYENSTELSLKLFEQLLVTASPYAKDIYNTISELIDPEQKLLLDNELGFLLEKSLFSSILSMTNINVSRDYLEDLFKGENTIYDRIYQLKEKYPENVFLSLLEGDIKSGYKFVKFDNSKKKAVEIVNSFTKYWEEAINQTDDIELQELAEDLINYTYITSAFQTNITSFYENIPANPLRDKVELGILDFKNRNIGNARQTIEDIFENNWNEPKLVPQLKASQLKDKKRILENGTLVLKEVKSGTFKGIHNKPYIHVIGSKGGVLYKKMGVSENDSYYYVPVTKKGLKVDSYYIYEYGNTSDSAFSENNNEKYKETRNFVEHLISIKELTRDKTLDIDIPFKEGVIEEANNRGQIEGC